MIDFSSTKLNKPLYIGVYTWLPMHASKVMEGNSKRSFLILCLLQLLSLACAKVHYHEFVVQEKQVKRLCTTSTIITVNGLFPGPTLEVNDGDSLEIKVVNRVKNNVSIHWHGVRQMRTGWADGPAYVTQCPIKYGGSYTYRFTIENQEGTLWWHAHSSWLRTTVYGAIIIHPKEYSSYPFTKPQREALVILGQWWIKDYKLIAERALNVGGVPIISDAFLINGQPGDLFQCSSRETTVINVAAGETVLLRFINAAMENELFVAIAGHTMTVVAMDASYTKPFTTSYLMLGPGQTTDVLIHTNQPNGRYYIAARAYASVFPFILYDNTTTTAILNYDVSRSDTCTGTPHISNCRPLSPLLPDYRDSAAAEAFGAGLKSPVRVNIPGPVDEHLFIALGLGCNDCPPRKLCGGPNGTMLATSMNNISFVLPRTNSMLQAAHRGQPGVFTTDFPASPPVEFNYTGNNISQSLWQPMKATKIYKMKYGSVVQMVLQGTSILVVEEHPIHIHGYNFYVLATGKGNFDQERDAARFNLVDPPMRSTIGVPARGWAVIRFVADNPGVWLVHCHIDLHFEWGMGMAFLVDNGVNEMESIMQPPPDLPRC